MHKHLRMTSQKKLQVTLAVCLLLFTIVACQKTASPQIDIVNSSADNKLETTANSTETPWFSTIITYYQQQDSSVSSPPPPPSPIYALTVEQLGTEIGTVTSNLGTINCGITCTDSYTSGTVVTLTAIPPIGLVFDNWGGCDSTPTATTCVVEMSAAKTVTARFDFPPPPTLTVTKTGTGSGTVVSNVGAINCGTTCTDNYTSETTVTLTATAATGSIFHGWNSSCDSTPTATTCVVAMSAARTVTPIFTLVLFAPLTVIKAGTGSGNVVSSVGAINCGTTCTDNYPLGAGAGAPFNLVATPAVGSTFTGWTGCDFVPSPTTCIIFMSAARTITATFD